MEKINQKFYKTNLPCPVNVTGVYTIHYFKYGKRFRFPLESHDFWEMIFIDSGQAKVITDNKTCNLKQGEAIFHKPNVAHTIYTEENFANSAIISFECKSKALNTLANKIFTLSDYEKNLLNKIIAEAKISYNDKLNDVYLTKMNKKAVSPFGGEQIIKNSIELLIISLLRNDYTLTKDREENNVSVNSNKIVDLVKNVLLEKLDNASKVNLDDISYRIGFSKSYIKTHFKLATGFSIIKYFINLKIDKAKKLLSQQKYQICEIADLLGFSSVYYFSRQFKLCTDMSPSEYLNSIKAYNIL